MVISSPIELNPLIIGIINDVCLEICTTARDRVARGSSDTVLKFTNFNQNMLQGMGWQEVLGIKKI